MLLEFQRLFEVGQIHQPHLNENGKDSLCTHKEKREKNGLPSQLFLLIHARALWGQQNPSRHGKSDSPSLI